jgi:prepilin-type N-terminal cleavage/methylation domain-containing protein
MKAKGFTLIELATVLAIIAVLAAVITPTVANYVDQARTARALGDTKGIADAIRLYQRDVGEFPIFDNTTEAGADAVGSDGILLAGTGGTPTDSVGGGAWTTGLATTTLTTYVNNNYLSRATSAAVGKVVSLPRILKTTSPERFVGLSQSQPDPMALWKPARLRRTAPLSLQPVTI